MPESIIANKFVPAVGVTITASTALWTPAAANKAIRLLGFTVSMSAAASILLQSGVSGATVFQVPALLIATPFDIDLSNTQGILLPANTPLAAISSAAGAVTGTFWGVEE